MIKLLLIIKINHINCCYLLFFVVIIDELGLIYILFKFLYGDYLIFYLIFIADS